MQYPKGVLVAIGGAEAKSDIVENEKQNSLDFFKEGILQKIVELASRKSSPRIEVVTTASSIPDEVARAYKKAFRKFGGLEIGHLKIATREDAESKKNIERLEACNCVLFSGGDQLRLCSVIGGTPFLHLLRERYQNEYFIVAGTSAGAAAQGTTMISSGDAAEAYIKGRVSLNLGLGFLPDAILDTHFDSRGRFGRLVQAIAAQPGAIGIGLDEDTGVIIEKGRKLKAIGSGCVVLLDGTHVTHNNIADIRDGAPLSVSNLVVHIMTNTDLFDLETRKFTGMEFAGHT